MTSRELPRGFVAAGRNVGIKNSKRDAGVILSRVPAVWAARVTQNRSRAHCVDRVDRMRGTRAPIRAVVAVSGNANALTGEEGARDDEKLATIIATELGVEPTEVLTACTGVMGHRLPLERIQPGLEKMLTELDDDPTGFAAAIHTTDRVEKIETRTIFVEGTEVRLHAIAKGSGMIAPSLATMMCFLTTDGDVEADALQKVLDDTVGDTFNQLTVDGEMSTNDAVFAFANGKAKNRTITVDDDDYATLRDAVREMFEALAKAIAADGEGATRRIDVNVVGAATADDARGLARAVAGSTLVKAAVFGADPNAACRMIATAGAHATRHDAAFDREKVTLRVQGQPAFADGTAQNLREIHHQLQQQVVEIELDVQEGEATASAWGCDLTYDYVKINADYAAITETSVDGRVGVNERLEKLGPIFKRRLLVEALRYIDRFRGMRAIIKLGGAAMVDPKLEEHFAEDVLLLRSVGLRPIVVHGGGPEISRTMERLGQKAKFIDGLRVTDANSMGTVEMVLTGSVNQRLVATLNRHGSRAVGLSGKDGGLIRAKKKVTETDLGRVGEVEAVDTRVIDLLEQDGYVPVVSPVGLGEEGIAYNVNADTVAAALAASLGAAKLIYLSDVPGLLDGEEVVSELTADQLKLRLDGGSITGGMKPKLASALEALAAGCSSVHLVDGRVQHNLIAELFTDRGVGTLIRRA